MERQVRPAEVRHGWIQKARGSTGTCSIAKPYHQGAVQSEAWVD